jgi:hypothetical protein
VYKEKIDAILSPISNVHQDFITKKVIPNEYVVYRIGVSSNKSYGDGKVVLLQPLCQIDVFSSGVANYTLADQVEELLNQNEITANRINLGYLEDVKRTQVSFDFYLNL